MSRMRDLLSWTNKINKDQDTGYCCPSCLKYQINDFLKNKTIADFLNLFKTLFLTFLGKTIGLDV